MSSTLPIYHEENFQITWQKILSGPNFNETFIDNFLTLFPVSIQINKNNLLPNSSLSSEKTFCQQTKKKTCKQKLKKIEKNENLFKFTSKNIFKSKNNLNLNSTLQTLQLENEQEEEIDKFNSKEEEEKVSFEFLQCKDILNFIQKNSLLCSNKINNIPKEPTTLSAAEVSTITKLKLIQNYLNEL
ncbi:hypothetical protein HK099_003156, partial [Clydaea vesicula]